MTNPFASLLNPLVKKILGALVRAALVAAGTYAVNHAIVSAADATTFIESATPLVASLVWSIYEKRNSLVLLNTAQAMPEGTTIQETKEAITAGMGVKASVPESAIPQLKTDVN